MSEMIERVARAIAKADATVKGQFDDTEMGDIFWDEWKHLYIPMARAALKVIRDPTDEMHQAGLETTGMPDQTFRDMIDAALKEKS